MPFGVSEFDLDDTFDWRTEGGLGKSQAARRGTCSAFSTLSFRKKFTVYLAAADCSLAISNVSARWIALRVHSELRSACRKEKLHLVTEYARSLCEIGVDHLQPITVAGSTDFRSDGFVSKQKREKRMKIEKTEPLPAANREGHHKIWIIDGTPGPNSQGALSFLNSTRRMEPFSVCLGHLCWW